MFEDTVPPGDAPPLTIAPAREARSFSPDIRPAPVQADLTFTLTDLYGRVWLTVQRPPAGWVVKSIRYRGDDITDRAIEFTTSQAHEIEVVLTSRTAVVSGSVTDDSGSPAAETNVILLPADAEVSTSSFDRYPVTSVAKGGRFQLPRVRAGDYRIIAVPSAVMDANRRQSTPVEALLKHAERITLVENDKLTMNLRVVTLR